MSDVKQTVPYSAGRYFLHAGKVIDMYGIEMPIHVDPAILNRVKLENVTYENSSWSVWKLPEMLQVPSLPLGNYYIPGFTKYAMNDIGEVYEIERFKRMTEHRHRRGYVYLHLKTDNGKWGCIGRHRAMLLVFTDYPLHYRVLEGNHLNCVPGDDRLANLEWTTPIQNKVHYTASTKSKIRICKKRYESGWSTLNVLTGENRTFKNLTSAAMSIGLRRLVMLGRTRYHDETVFYDGYRVKRGTKDWSPTPEQYSIKYDAVVPVEVRNVKSGIVRSYKSIVEAAADLKVPKDLIAYRCKQPSNRVYPDGNQYRHPDFRFGWSDPTTNKFGVLRPILVRRVMDGKVTKFDRSIDACRYTGLSPAGLVNRLKQPASSVWNDGYQLSYADTGVVDWGSDTEVNTGCLRKVKTINDVTGEVIIYQSAKACADANHLLKTTLNWRLKKKGLQVYDGLRYMYH